MAPDLGNSKPTDDRNAIRARDYRRMRMVAGGLLAVMVLTFVAATLAPRHWPDFAITADYVRAFAEAAMIGALADWFAVVALFRHPFGLPIPHTAIIARNKSRIGDSLGAFICNNFLAPEVVAAKLDSLDAAGRLTRWLGERDNREILSRRIVHLSPAIVDLLGEGELGGALRQAILRGLGSAPVAPMAGRVLTVLMARGHHHALFDRILDLAADLLLSHQDEIRARVADGSWRWMPRWVDEKLADKLLMGALETLAELRSPDHPWRADFQRSCLTLAHKLSSDPALIAKGEALKGDVLNQPEVQAYLDHAWAEARQRLKQDLAEGEPGLQAGIERAAATFAARLTQDAHLRAVLNRWLRRTVERVAVPYRGDIGAFIAGVVARWDTDTLVSKLELQVGKDLQYIRINGTLVGGLVGIGIHALARWLG